jgi:ribonuclease HI
VLYALKWFKEPSNIIIYSDSQYIVNSINNGSARKWFEEQDYTKKNLDIWVEILDLISWHEKVEFRWVKGHAGNKYNELVDTLCTHAANCLNLKEDICISD